MKRNLYFFLVIIVSAGCFLLISMGGREKLPQKALKVNNIKIYAEIAATPETRQKGLMNRKHLKDTHGMLFIFERDQKLSFWMKNTVIPLSIAYISSEGVIMEIYELKPESLRPVKSINSVRYALEMNQGWFKENNVKAGDIISW